MPPEHAERKIGQMTVTRKLTVAFHVAVEVHPKRWYAEMYHRRALQLHKRWTLRAKLTVSGSDILPGFR